jgi:Delta carbonic anhydrase
LTDTASQTGVQAQNFNVVNGETYFWPDLMRTMIGGMGTDIAKYTGSTTGNSRNNEICSQDSPMTWQIDRKCHMISASSFDKLCYACQEMFTLMALANRRR